MRSAARRAIPAPSSAPVGWAVAARPPNLCAIPTSRRDRLAGEAERRRDLRIVGAVDIPAPAPPGGGDGAADHHAPNPLVGDLAVPQGQLPNRLGKRTFVDCRHARYSSMPRDAPAWAAIARAWTFRPRLRISQRTGTHSPAVSSEARQGQFPRPALARFSFSIVYSIAQEIKLVRSSTRHFVVRNYFRNSASSGLMALLTSFQKIGSRRARL